MIPLSYKNTCSHVHKMSEKSQLCCCLQRTNAATVMSPEKGLSFHPATAFKKWHQLQYCLSSMKLQHDLGLEQESACSFICGLHKTPLYHGCGGTGHILFNAGCPFLIGVASRYFLIFSEISQ